MPCDIPIPAAIEATINCRNAKAIQASLVVETANIPTTHLADLTLQEQGITVVPDLVANSGGVLASYNALVVLMNRFAIWRTNKARICVLRPTI